MQHFLEHIQTNKKRNDSKSSAVKNKSQNLKTTRTIGDEEENSKQKKMKTEPKEEEKPEMEQQKELVTTEKIIDEKIQTFDISTFSKKEIEKFLKENKIISGDKEYSPMLTFESGKFSNYIHETLSLSKYGSPTAIQAISFPIILKNENAVFVSKNCPGKALAFIIPAVSHAIKMKSITTGGPIVSLFFLIFLDFSYHTNKRISRRNFFHFQEI
jgi:hypothetical protein